MGQLKLIAIAVGIAVLIGIAYVVNGWREDAATLLIEREAHAKEVVRLNDRIVAEITNTRKANEASNRYQARIAELEKPEPTATPFPAVRVCNSAPARVPEARAASGSDAAAAPDDAPADEGNRDIGPDLKAFALRCEANAIQLDELQNWIRNR